MFNRKKKRIRQLELEIQLLKSLLALNQANRELETAINGLALKVKQEVQKESAVIHLN